MAIAVDKYNVNILNIEWWLFFFYADILLNYSFFIVKRTAIYKLNFLLWPKIFMIYLFISLFFCVCVFMLIIIIIIFNYKALRNEWKCCGWYT